MSNVIDVTSETFKTEVIDRSFNHPVVIDFWSERCQPCLVLGPQLEALAEAADGSWTLAKINTEQNQQLAAQFAIRSIPAVKAIVDGQIVDEFVGALPLPQIEAFIAKILPNEFDIALKEGRAALLVHDFATALEKFEFVLSNDADNYHAIAGKALIAIAGNQLDKAEELLAQIPEALAGTLDGLYEEIWLNLEIRTFDAGDDSSASATKYARALEHANNQQWEDAFGLLVEIIAVDRQWRDDLARRALVKMFSVIGIHSELADVWRRKMGSAMY